MLALLLNDRDDVRFVGDSTIDADAVPFVLETSHDAEVDTEDVRVNVLGGVTYVIVIAEVFVRVVSSVKDAVGVGVGGGVIVQL